MYSYLDDLCLAGDALAVKAALDTLKARCQNIGLTLSTGLVSPDGRQLSKDKCELIPTGGAASTVDVTQFPSDFKVVRDGNFELLGGPVGTPQHCNSHTQARATKALRVLEALGEVPDPQVALQLLRRCAGFSKMVYSIRVVPASYHTDALKDYDAKVSACFEQFTCLHPDEGSWLQATLSTEHGGLGLRSLSQHCHAAYLASRSSCHALCKDLDPAHTFQSGSGSEPTPERLAFDNYNSSVNDDSRLPRTLSVNCYKRSCRKLSTTAARRCFPLLTWPVSPDKPTSVSPAPAELACMCTPPLAKKLSSTTIRHCSEQRFNAGCAYLSLRKTTSVFFAMESWTASATMA